MSHVKDYREGGGEEKDTPEKIEHTAQHFVKDTLYSQRPCYRQPDSCRVHTTLHWTAGNQLPVGTGGPSQSIKDAVNEILDDVRNRGMIVGQ